LLGLTQEEAAARSHVSPRYWRRLEDRDEPPAASIEVVEQLLAGLDWSWSELIEAIGHERVRAEEQIDGAERLFRAAWRKATSREREMVTAVLQVVTRKRASR
jgi:hypothetical protein